MTHASLFSGIGGFDLAAHWAGWENLFNCEINPFCQTVLKHHFPNATQYSDITTTDFTPWRGKIDVLTGGFPCQPFSQSGKRKGTADNRYLWPQMLGAIRQIQPRWIVGENVRGIVSWSKGLVFEQVCSDLEAAGYEVTPFLLPACSVDAPHERYRVWFIAHAKCERLQPTAVQPRTTSKVKVSSRHRMPTLEVITANDVRSKSNKYGIIDGIPEGLDECSLHAYGNAIVPQIAFQIFNAINQYNNLIQP